ncbi:MAG: FAD-dependent oxidoreductase, partial [Pseudomonadota bacterium]
MRATMQEVFDGLEVVSQNRWPSLKFDVGEVNDKLSRALPAGFYYKTFMWPKGFWDALYEPVIRRAAGLGTAPVEIDPDRYAARYAHADVLVVGAGPAGLAAALAAGRAGADVILVDEHPQPGGALLSDSETTIDGLDGAAFAARVLAELESLPNVRVLARTTGIAHDHQNMVICAERLIDHLAHPPEGAPRERLWRVRAAEVVHAQGAVERPMVFAGNDRPGVMLAGAALTYLERFGVAVGREVAVATTHDSAYRTAFALADAGISVAAVADARSSVAEDLLAAAKARGIEVMTGVLPTGTRGRLRVRGVALSGGQRIACEALLMCGGWTPSVHLHSHTKGKLHWTGEAFVPKETSERAQSAGASTGLWGINAALTSGAAAGKAAAEKAGFSGKAVAFRVDGEREDGGVAPAPGVGKKAFVDFQNDVTAKDIRLAVGEGMRSIEHVKRYTTNGMATDQGKTSNINALVIAAETLQKSPPDVGLTTFRPPFTPVTFGAVANHHRGVGFTPLRKTPVDAWAADQGAVFEPVGEWRRARYFPEGEETMHAAV